MTAKPLRFPGRYRRGRALVGPVHAGTHGTVNE
jgi:hypothetical protein